MCLTSSGLPAKPGGGTCSATSMRIRVIYILAIDRSYNGNGGTCFAPSVVCIPTMPTPGIPTPSDDDGPSRRIL